MKKLMAGLCALLLCACQSNISGDTYAVSETGQMSDVYMGKIISMRDVLVKESKRGGRTGTGAFGGAAAGGITASGIGRGRGAGVATVGGAIVGGVIGDRIEDKVTEQRGIEYIIQLTDGKTVAVTQGLKPVLQLDQEVLVIFSGSKDRKKRGARVVPR